jgi:hypothetical protein
MTWRTIPEGGRWYNMIQRCHKSEGYGLRNLWRPRDRGLRPPEIRRVRLDDDLNRDRVNEASDKQRCHR